MAAASVGASAPFRIAVRASSSVRRRLASVALRPKRSTAARPGPLRKASSTEGNCRNNSIGFVMRRLSIANQKIIDARAAQTFLTHQKIETERRYVVGDRLNRGIDCLIEDLQIAVAFATAFGLDRAAAALDLAIGNPLRGAAGDAAYAHIVP